MRSENNVANEILKTELISPLDDASGLELHHPIISIIWGGMEAG